MPLRKEQDGKRDLGQKLGPTLPHLGVFTRWLQGAQLLGRLAFLPWGASQGLDPGVCGICDPWAESEVLLLAAKRTPSMH